jgi:hypothetical protein
MTPDMTLDMTIDGTSYLLGHNGPGAWSVPPRVGQEPVVTPAQAAALTECPEPQRPLADRTWACRSLQRRETEVVRERAAGVAAAVGPAALEIIAESRARQWAWTARLTDEPVRSERARARSAEWHRIAVSVSMLLALRRDE